MTQNGNGNYRMRTRGAIQEAFALLLSSFQSGFRKGRSTIDALVRVSNDVEKTLKMKEIRAIMYFDIEKAYDSMWRDGLLIKLSRMGIGGRMYNWVRAFLTDRTFRVKVGADISNYLEIENGIPQGSAVSPILCNIMINDIFTCLDTCIQSALYADDGPIWMRGRNAPRNGEYS